MPKVSHFLGPDTERIVARGASLLSGNHMQAMRFHAVKVATGVPNISFKADGYAAA